MMTNLKELGNSSFKSKEYHKAIDYYSRAINQEPSAVLYSNRAQAYLLLHQYENVIQDCRDSLQLETTPKAFYRLALAHFHLGDLQKAKETCHLLSDMVDPLLEILDRFEELYLNQDYSGALHILENGFLIFDPELLNTGLSKHSRISTNSCTKVPVSWRLKRADCLLHVDIQEASQVAMDLLRSKQESKNSNAIYVRAKTMYLLDSHSITDIIGLLQTGLQLDPDNKSCRLFVKKVKLLDELKQKGNNCFTAHDYNQALILYQKVLESSPRGIVMVKVLSNCAIVYSKLQQHDKVLEVVQTAMDLLVQLELVDSFSNLVTKLLSRRADSYIKTKEYEKAIQDYQQCMELDPTSRGTCKLTRI
jgi:DnaJ family protein C protein 7